MKSIQMINKIRSIVEKNIVILSLYHYNCYANDDGLLSPTSCSYLSQVHTFNNGVVCLEKIFIRPKQKKISRTMQKSKKCDAFVCNTSIKFKISNNVLACH